jgi:polysaccharide biosynthesis transport protein
MMVSDVYRTLWRSKLLVALIAGIVVATAFAMTSRETKLYTAYSLVRVQQTVQREDEVFGALVTGERLARTYEHIAETFSVRQLVDEGLPSGASSGGTSINARQVSNLELLQIAVTGPDPEVAAAVANEVPDALASFIEETGTVRDTITVVERAGVPSFASSPNLKLNLTLALMLGLILGGGIALLKESFSDRIKDVEELERVARHPVIATIPNLKFAPRPTRPRSNGRQKQVEGLPRPAEVTRIESPEGAEVGSRWSVRG